MFYLTKESKEFSLLTLLDSYHYEQRAKKVVSDSSCRASGFCYWASDYCS